MNMNDFEQIKKNLKEESNENCRKIDELDKKIRTISSNDFETKSISALAFSVISWMGSMLLMPIIVKSGNIPLNIIQPLFAGVSALIGVMGEELFTKKAKLREKLREFSSSKTRKEKIEESTRYEIEKKKLESFNKILEQSYDDLSEKENMIYHLSDIYSIAEKDIDNRTKEEITNNIESINEVLIKKQHNVDIIATKCVLKDKFWRIRDKFNRFSDAFIFGMVGAMLFMMLYDMPIFYIRLLENMPIEISTFGIYVPTIIGGLVCGGYV